MKIPPGVYEEDVVKEEEPKRPSGLGDAKGQERVQIKTNAEDCLKACA